MVNAMEWLHNQEKYNTEEKRVWWKLIIKNKNLEGHLDLREFVNLKELDCSNNQLTSLDLSGCGELTRLICSSNKLTSLDVSANSDLTTLDCYYNQLTSLNASGCGELTRLDCSNNQLTSLNASGCGELTRLICYYNQLTSLDVSQCPKLTDLYTDDKLFTENKITGLEKTSIVRLDCRGGDLLQKSRDPKFIWEVFVRKYNVSFPEMELINIADLTEIAQQVNEETVNNKEFLTKICLLEIKFLINNNKDNNYYWVLDQLANTILARCLIIQNRLYEGEDIEYEKNLIELAQQTLKCNAMNPKNPAASLYENRARLVNKALNGDIELLSRLQDLPYLNPEYKKVIEIAKWDSIKNNLELEKDFNRLVNDGYWDKKIQTLHDDRLPLNKKQIALQTQRRSWLKNQQKQQTETRIEIETAPRTNNN